MSELFHEWGTRVQTCAGFDFEEVVQVLCANSWHQISMNMHHKLNTLTFVVELDPPTTTTTSTYPFLFIFPRAYRIFLFFGWPRLVAARQKYVKSDEWR